MRKTYQYKLRLTPEQRARIERWLDMLRHQYNYLLAERFRWWQYNRCDVILPQGEFCLRYCQIGSQELKDNPDWHSQSASLPRLKKERPWYKDIYSQVLQDGVKRVRLAFDRYLKGDANGNRSGKPRFKNQNRYRTFTFPSIKDENLVGNTIKLPKLGVLKFIKSQEITDGFKLKTASITRKADGYYISFSTEDKSVPQFNPDTVPTEENTLGVDLGLEKLYVDSNGNQAQPQKYFRKSEERLGKLQQKLEDNSRSKKAKRLLRQAIARLHQKIARQRKDWHYKQAHQIFRGCDVLVIEDLNVCNLKRKNQPKKEDGKFVPNGQSSQRGLNKSWLDNAVGQFVEILHQVAQKYGARIIKVNPYGTSQHCSQCLNRVSKSLSDRWHKCPQCGLSIDRDENSAILIKRIAIEIESVAVDSRNAKTLPSLKLILG